MNLCRFLSPSFENFHGKRAVEAAGTSYTYGRIRAEAAKRAHWLLKAGVRKGDRVALLLPKGMDFIFAHLAILAAGAVSLPLNPGYSAKEISAILEDAQPAFLLTDSRCRAPLRPALFATCSLRTVLVDAPSPGGEESWIGALEALPGNRLPVCAAEPDDPALLLYTSGTTGKPKGAMITHRNLIFNIQTLRSLWAWDEKDVLLHVLPLFHIHGLAIALHGALLAGSPVILQEKFEPQATWKTIAEKRCTLLMAVPTIYHRLLQEGSPFRPDLSSMRLFISGAAPLSAALFNRFAEKTGFRILERYGMTEAGVIASNSLAPAQRVPGSVGYALPGVRIRVVSEDGTSLPAGEVGEVWIRGDNVFKGYWRNPEKTGEALSAGWFRSGDLGYLDPKDPGRLFLVGRSKDLIISGGLNVYPAEVETVLEQHPAVQEAAVIGLPDEDFGERVTAAVTVRGRATPFLPEEIIGHCKRNLIGYKCPKEVFLVERLPRNALGKVEKSVLQKACAAAAAGGGRPLTSNRGSLC